jgi:hypothetical protein
MMEAGGESVRRGGESISRLGKPVSSHRSYSYPLCLAC